MMLRIALLLCLSSLAWGLAAGRVPYSLNVEWHLLRKSVGNISFTEIPRNTEKILLFNDSYDLGKAPAKSAAVFYNEFESGRDGVMQIGMAADWWFECRLNGEAVYSTLTGGNREQQFSPENHVFNLPVKKGRNLLAVRVLAGAAARPEEVLAGSATTSSAMVFHAPQEGQRPSQRGLVSPQLVQT